MDNLALFSFLIEIYIYARGGGGKITMTGLPVLSGMYYKQKKFDLLNNLLYFKYYETLTAYRDTGFRQDTRGRVLLCGQDRSCPPIDN
jgi:hypothetical protein